MRHAREDYNRIQDPALHDPSLLAPGTAPIGEDEPVFLLRARDTLAPEVVREWGRRARAAGREEIAKVALRWAYEMERWQERNGSKLPDLPTSGGERGGVAGADVRGRSYHGR